MKTGREMPRNFGEKLRFYRQEKKYSLKEVQRMTGVDAGYISKLENQSRKCPSYPILQSIASALSVSIADLIDIDIPEAPLRSIQETLIFSEYLIMGRLPTSSEREAMLSVIQAILDSEWQENSKHTDTIKIIEKVDRLLRLLR